MSPDETAAPHRRDSLSALVVALTLASGCHRGPEVTFDPDAKRNVDPFPQAEAGHTRHVFFLPVEGENVEPNMRVELVGAKEIEVDCNLHILGGEFERISLEGWGYGYYVFHSEGRYLSTRVGCGGQPWTLQLVTAPSEMIDYNSRLPIIVYAPEEYVIRYRIYRGGELLPEQVAPSS